MSIKRFFVSTIISALLASTAFSVKSYAHSDLPMYFDFQDTVMSIDAGGSKKMSMRANYNYTYHIGPHTSKGTYLECSFKSGTQDVIFHIGADEQVKNVMFHFYVDDEEVQSDDTHDNVEVYVQNAASVSNSVQVQLAKKKIGKITKTGNIAMLYNDKDVAMASFSLTNGNGQMASLEIKGVANKDGSNYFDVVSATNSAPVISESDKAVMKANGFAGVCVNGEFKQWP
ncbi:MAG: hypothetical protein J5802_11370 [Butyrivibrio sp.]|nr:hypothetical protein [Butyrivibrio sp.]